MPVRPLLLAFLLLLSVPAMQPADAQQQQPQKQAFVIDLQKALRANDQIWLADHMRFPVRHNTSRKALIRSKTAFLKNYSAIISAKLQADVLAQDPANVFENWQGMMIGSGSRNIWVREFGEGADKHYGIVTINDGD